MAVYEGYHNEIPTFRVWDLVNKKWFNPEEIYINDGEVFSDYRELEDNRPLKDNEYVITYASGIYDASSTPVKVFDGDILMRNDGFAAINTDLYIVKYGEYTESPDGYHEVKAIGFYGCQDDIQRGKRKEEHKISIAYLIDMSDCIVVGNIFDNDHPLEVLQ